MNSRFKVTYLEYGVVKSVVFMTNLWNMHSDISNKGIDPNNVIRIERVLEASEENTINED